MHGIQDAVAIVTGASSGIGAAVARAFVAAGWHGRLDFVVCAACTVQDHGVMGPQGRERVLPTQLRAGKQ